MNGPDCPEAQECRGDFWITLERAIKQAGGALTVEQLAGMKFEDVVNMLAQNGIRMVYLEAAHINNRRQATCD